MLPAHAPQMILKWFEERPRKHGDAILLTFALPDGDLPAAEVQILHAQRERFQKPQPRTIEQCAHQAWDTLQFGEDGLGLVAGQHHRQPFRLARPHYPFDSIQGLS